MVCDIRDDDVHAAFSHGMVNHGAEVHGTTNHGEVVHGKTYHDAMVHDAGIHDDVAYDEGCGVAKNAGNDEVVGVAMMTVMVHRDDGDESLLVVALTNSIRKLLKLNKAVYFQIMQYKICFKLTIIDITAMTSSSVTPLSSVVMSMMVRGWTITRSRAVRFRRTATLLIRTTHVVSELQTVTALLCL